MIETKQIAGTPADNDMVRPFGLSFRPEGHEKNQYECDVVVLTVPRKARGGIRLTQVEYALDQFYELREACNALYDHIRQEQPSD